MQDIRFLTTAVALDTLSTSCYPDAVRIPHQVKVLDKKVHGRDIAVRRTHVPKPNRKNRW